MPNPKPNPIKAGQAITAKWLNRAWQYGIKTLRVGPGLSLHINDAGDATLTLQRQRHAIHTWQPAPFKVKEVAGDYLVANAYDPTDQSILTEDVYIAKPDPLRSGSATWTTRPEYIAGDSVIYAAPMGPQGVNEPGGDAILLLDLNIDGRRADGFWGKVTAGTLNSSNVGEYIVTEQRRTEDGWQDLAGGRTIVIVVNAVEANNSSSGIQGIGVDLDGQIFTDNGDLEIQPIRGDPVHWVHIDQDLTSGAKRYTIEAANAIDGECA